MDRTDRKILKLLQEDGRITTVDLADRIGLSPTATSERVKRLFRERYVTGFRAMLDPQRNSGAACWFSWRSASTRPPPTSSSGSPKP